MTPITITRTRQHNLMRSESSFNLVELSLAIAVFAIGVVSVFGILPHLLQSSRKAVDYNSITLDIQDFMDDPAHCGFLSTADLANTYDTNFPSTTVSTNISASSFQFTRRFVTMVATNADVTSSTTIKSYTNASGNPLLRTLYVTYAWGATNNPTNAQTFTFITEAAATTNLVCK